MICNPLKLLLWHTRFVKMLPLRLTLHLSFLNSEKKENNLHEINKAFCLNSTLDGHSFNYIDSCQVQHPDYSNNKSDANNKDQIESSVMDSAPNVMKHPEIARGAAVWDIFRRQDVPDEYLLKHQQEFFDLDHSPVQFVAHHIPDQIFFLDEKHKKHLKEEFSKFFFFFLRLI